MRRNFRLAGAVIGLLAVAPPARPSGLALDYPAEFTARYCVECHSAADPAADVVLESAPYDLGEDESRAFTEDDYRTVGTKFILSIYEMHGMWK